MKRPIELTVALAVLGAEYLAVVPGYISAFLARIAAQQVTVQIAAAFLSFLIIRPVVLYLLWRGTSWVRTWIIWTLPLSFVLIVLLKTATPATSSSQHASTGNMVDAYEALRAGNLLTTIALFFGLLALLTLYSPRVAAWFRHMQLSRANRNSGGT